MSEIIPGNSNRGNVSRSIRVILEFLFSVDYPQYTFSPGVPIKVFGSGDRC